MHACSEPSRPSLHIPPSPTCHHAGHALSYLVEDYGSRKELADRLLYELFLRGLMEQEERGGEEEVSWEFVCRRVESRGLALLVL